MVVSGLHIYAFSLVQFVCLVVGEPWLVRINFDSCISPSQSVLLVKYNWWVEPH